MKIHEAPIDARLKNDPIHNAGFLSSRSRAVRVGNVTIGGPGFAVIAGPCSIESREQFLETALSVKQSGAVLLRGGIWKLRTSPKTFQGLGPEAAGFIREILDQTGLQLVSEITDPRQIEVLDPLIGMYQVGARNMYNYALLKELGQTKKPILLKRGFSALVDEWIKAAEYITTGGNDQVILCERGIRTFENSTRYTFDLNAILVAKSRCDFPVVVDPSHSVGVREYVPKVALAAAVAGADGIIVEVHPRPAEALSDGFQSLTLDGFRDLSQDLERVLLALGRPMLKPLGL